jgi:hypothetical protein
VLIEIERPARLTHLRVDLLLAELLREAQRERDVLVHGEMRVEGVVLEHHREVPVARGEVVDAPVPDDHVAGSDVLEADDHPQQRRLPAAGGADEDHELAIRHIDADVVDGREPVAVLLDDVPHLDRSHDSPTP